MKPVASWGRLTNLPHHVTQIQDPNIIADTFASSDYQSIPFGMGRSYGDCCLNPYGKLLLTSQLDKLISFDAENGLLTCQAGILLKDIQQIFIPRGWMLPVTPGTQMATLGGAIANDVHGKNHHSHATFGNHIQGITLVRSDGEIIHCGPESNANWFAATIGGIGLTGLIISATIRLQKTSSSWLDTETIPFNDLDEFLGLSEESQEKWQYTVSWIDCISRPNGRGLFTRAREAKTNQTQKISKNEIIMPFTPPISLVNKLSLQLFNGLYFNIGKIRKSQRITHYTSFFYPLDHIQEWNKIYGPNGFYQYQCLIPKHDAKYALQKILAEIALKADGSFLAVLKSFGKKPSLGMLSFAREGVTLALDFPNKSESTLQLFTRLDAVVKEVKGSIYPAKDARMPKNLFELSQPRLSEFLNFKDPGMSSSMSKRLMDC